jgi:hypothetical protein
VIPISSDAKYIHREEKTGNEYHFRYLLESDKQAEYSQLCRRESERITALCETAKPLLPPEATEKEIRLKAYELLNEQQGPDQLDRIAEMDSYINIFLCGWSGKGFPEFPKDGKPTRCFKYFQKMEMYRIIMDKIPELTGFTEDEIKN